jgi:DNA topoisomerase-2
MGQNFVGANNLPVVEGVGQFGSRGGRGKDYAPSRHLRVKLPSFLRFLFPSEDDDLLE